MNQLGGVVPDTNSEAAESWQVGRTLTHPDPMIAGWVVTALFGMQEPFTVVPLKSGGYQIGVRIEVRESHIKEYMWDNFQDLRTKLRKAGLGKPTVARKLEPFIERDT